METKIEMVDGNKVINNVRDLADARNVLEAQNAEYDYIYFYPFYNNRSEFQKYGRLHFSKEQKEIGYWDASTKFVMIYENPKSLSEDDIKFIKSWEN